MALARRILLRLETGCGKPLYAQRTGWVQTYWYIALPGGLEAKTSGGVADCVEELKRIAEEAYGGAGKLWAQSREGGFEPYAPGCLGPNAAKRRRDAVKRQESASA